MPLCPTLLITLLPRYTPALTAHSTESLQTLYSAWFKATIGSINGGNLPFHCQQDTAEITQESTVQIDIL